MERVILHCDMNNFYASVECRDDARLRGKAVAVCGAQELRHGIVLAKNEEAKRYGVKTGEAIWQARQKCPHLVIVPPRFERYVHFSRVAREIYRDYTDLVEPFGMDECWLDVTASRLAFGDGVTIAEEIRRRIRRETGLTISVGVSFNKVFAKMGSDMKKPDATTVLPRECMEEKIWPLAVENLLWVGRKTASVLHRYGVHSVGDLARTDAQFLALQFGKCGAMMQEAARGEDHSPVTPCDYEFPVKSVGRGMTTPRDLVTPEEVWVLILSLTEEVGAKLRDLNKNATGVMVSARDKNLFVQSFQTKLPAPTDSTMALARCAFDLFQRRCPMVVPLRSLTVRAIGLVDGGDTQLSLFAEKAHLRAEILDRAEDSLCRRFGKGTVTRASLLRVPYGNRSDYIPFTAI